jgi:succinate dehydrogenase flavin-adding protein (antitoxin of CptAB toxin-antitoxin module)
MRELDLVLDAWLEQRYDAATPEQRAAFCELLERPDPQILDYLTDRDQPDTEPLRALTDVLKRIHDHSNG